MAYSTLPNLALEKGISAQSDYAQPVLSEIFQLVEMNVSDIQETQRLNTFEIILCGPGKMQASSQHCAEFRAKLCSDQCCNLSPGKHVGLLFQPKK